MAKALKATTATLPAPGIEGYAAWLANWPAFSGTPCTTAELQAGIILAGAVTMRGGLTGAGKQAMYISMSLRTSGASVPQHTAVCNSGPARNKFNDCIKAGYVTLTKPGSLAGSAVQKLTLTQKGVDVLAAYGVTLVTDAVKAVKAPKRPKQPKAQPVTAPVATVDVPVAVDPVAVDPVAVDVTSN